MFRKCVIDTISPEGMRKIVHEIVLDRAHSWLDSEGFLDFDSEHIYAAGWAGLAQDELANFKLTRNEEKKIRRHIRQVLFEELKYKLSIVTQSLVKEIDGHAILVQEKNKMAQLLLDTLEELKAETTPLASE